MWSTISYHSLLFIPLFCSVECRSFCSDLFPPNLLHMIIFGPHQSSVWVLSPWFCASFFLVLFPYPSEAILHKLKLKLRKIGSHGVGWIPLERQQHSIYTSEQETLYHPSRWHQLHRKLILDLSVTWTNTFHFQGTWSWVSGTYKIFRRTRSFGTMILELFFHPRS